VQLIPKHPPGHANRKARAFGLEIARLRSEGYSCAAIRAALADVGVQVSLSTVQREATRGSKHRRPLVVSEVAAALRVDGPAPFPASALVSSIAVGDPRTGKQIAADFVSKRISNPLLRNRSNHESGGH
jgi:hypothetical protein